MPKYRYKAATAGGGELKGTYIAANKEDVVKMLRANRAFPIMVEEDNLLGDTGGIKTWSITAKDYYIMCRQLFAMINAGVPIIQSLNILRAQMTKKVFRAGLDTVYEDVQKGQLLSEAMKKQRRVFPELMINMIEAGELSGTLDGVLERLAYHYEREAKISNKVKSAMVYPIILTFVAFAVVTFLLTFVMPTFVGMFEGSGVPLPLPTRILMALSAAIQRFWYIFLIGIAVLVAATTRYLSTTEGKYKFDSLKLSIPVIKGLNQKIIATRFSRTLSTMLTSGIPLIQALENIEQTLGNKVVANDLRSVREDVQKGSDLAGPISRIKHFPPMIPSMIHVGEESGTLDDILKRTAEFYDEEVATEFDRVLALFEPFMIVIMGLMIGFIVISMALPMFDMVNTVQ